MNKPPQSIEAEQSVLGSVLKDSKALDETATILTNKSYFYLDKHKLIYAVILELYENNKPVDTTTVGEKLNNDLEKIGGRSYLIDLISGVASTINIKYYIDIVVEKYNTRELINICADAQENLYNSVSLQETMNKLDHALLNIVSNNEDIIIHGGVIASKIVDDIQNRDAEKLKSRYIETRIADLNSKINGIQKRHLTVIGAPPSMGKTSFALDIALFSKCRTLYVGLDETCRDAAMRLLTSLTSITNNQMNDYKIEIKPSEIDDLAVAATRICSQPIYLCEKTGLTAYQIRAMARQHQRQHGLDMLIIDYIQQIADGMKGENRNLEVTRQIRVLKDVAKELDIAVVAVSQINRDYSNITFNPAKKLYGCPKMNQLRDSGTIEQEANMILFVWNLVQAAKDRGLPLNDEKLWGTELVVKIQLGADPSFIDIAKNKTGEKGMIPCLWNGRRMQFYSEAR